jgi:hypothetical protein
LPQCSFHGRRKAAATRLIDAGSDVVEAAAITGHASLKELQRYIETRDRKKAARRGMNKLISGTELSNSGSTGQNESGSPSWIRIEPCAMRPKALSGVFWKVLVSFSLLREDNAFARSQTIINPTE